LAETASEGGFGTGTDTLLWVLETGQGQGRTEQPVEGSYNLAALC